MYPNDYPFLMKSSMSDKLQQDQDELQVERKEYKKYRAYLKNEVDDLITKNEQLLSCFISHKQIYEDLELQNKLLEEQYKKDIFNETHSKKIKAKLSQIKNKQDPMNPSRVLIPMENNTENRHTQLSHEFQMLEQKISQINIDETIKLLDEKQKLAKKHIQLKKEASELMSQLLKPENKPSKKIETLFYHMIDSMNECEKNRQKLFALKHGSQIQSSQLDANTEYKLINNECIDVLDLLKLFPDIQPSPKLQDLINQETNRKKQKEAKRKRIEALKKKDEEFLRNLNHRQRKNYYPVRPPTEKRVSKPNESISEEERNDRNNQINRIRTTLNKQIANLNNQTQNKIPISSPPINNSAFNAPKRKGRKSLNNNTNLSTNQINETNINKNEDNKLINVQLPENQAQHHKFKRFANKQRNKHHKKDIYKLRPPSPTEIASSSSTSSTRKREENLLLAALNNYSGVISKVNNENDQKYNKEEADTKEGKEETDQDDKNHRKEKSQQNKDKIPVFGSQENNDTDNSKQKEEKPNSIKINQESSSKSSRKLQSQANKEDKNEITNEDKDTNDEEKKKREGDSGNTFEFEQTLEADTKWHFKVDENHIQEEKRKPKKALPLRISPNPKQFIEEESEKDQNTNTNNKSARRIKRHKANNDTQNNSNKNQELPKKESQNPNETKTDMIINNQQEASLTENEKEKESESRFLFTDNDFKSNDTSNEQNNDYRIIIMTNSSQTVSSSQSSKQNPTQSTNLETEKQNSQKPKSDENVDMTNSKRRKKSPRKRSSKSQTPENITNVIKQPASIKSQQQEKQESEAKKENSTDSSEKEDEDEDKEESISLVGDEFEFEQVLEIDKRWRFKVENKNGEENEQIVKKSKRKITRKIIPKQENERKKKQELQNDEENKNKKEKEIGKGKEQENDKPEYKITIPDDILLSDDTSKEQNDDYRIIIMTNSSQVVSSSQTKTKSSSSKHETDENNQIESEPQPQESKPPNLGLNEYGKSTNIFEFEQTLEEDKKWRFKPQNKNDNRKLDKTPKFKISPNPKQFIEEESEKEPAAKIENSSGRRRRRRKRKHEKQPDEDDENQIETTESSDPKMPSLAAILHITIDKLLKNSKQLSDNEIKPINPVSDIKLTTSESTKGQNDDYRIIIMNNSNHQSSSLQSSKHESLPSKHESQSSKHKSQSSKHESQSSKHKSQSSKHESQSSKHESLPPKHESQSSKHESLPSKHQSQSSKHESLPSKHQSQSSKHESLPSKIESQSTKNESYNTQEKSDLDDPIQNDHFEEEEKESQKENKRVESSSSTFKKSQANEDGNPSFEEEEESDDLEKTTKYHIVFNPNQFNEESDKGQGYKTSTSEYNHQSDYSNNGDYKIIIMSNSSQKQAAEEKVASNDSEISKSSNKKGKQADKEESGSKKEEKHHSQKEEEKLENQKEEEENHESGKEEEEHHSQKEEEKHESEKEEEEKHESEKEEEEHHSQKEEEELESGKEEEEKHESEKEEEEKHESEKEEEEHHSQKEEEKHESEKEEEEKHESEKEEEEHHSQKEEEELESGKEEEKHESGKEAEHDSQKDKEEGKESSPAHSLPLKLASVPTANDNGINSFPLIKKKRPLHLEIDKKPTIIDELKNTIENLEGKPGSSHHSRKNHPRRSHRHRNDNDNHEYERDDNENDDNADSPDDGYEYNYEYDYVFDDKDYYSNDNKRTKRRIHGHHYRRKMNSRSRSPRSHSHSRSRSHNRQSYHNYRPKQKQVIVKQKERKNLIKKGNYSDDDRDDLSQKVQRNKTFSKSKPSRVRRHCEYYSDYNDQYSSASDDNNGYYYSDDYNSDYEYDYEIEEKKVFVPLSLQISKDFFSHEIKEVSRNPRVFQRKIIPKPPSQQQPKLSLSLSPNNDDVSNLIYQKQIKESKTLSQFETLNDFVIHEPNEAFESLRKRGKGDQLDLEIAQAREKLANIDNDIIDLQKKLKKSLLKDSSNQVDDQFSMKSLAAMKNELKNNENSDALLSQAKQQRDSLEKELADKQNQLNDLQKLYVRKTQTLRHYKQKKDELDEQSTFLINASKKQIKKINDLDEQIRRGRKTIEIIDGRIADLRNIIDMKTKELSVKASKKRPDVIGMCGKFKKDRISEKEIIQLIEYHDIERQYLEKAIELSSYQLSDDSLTKKEFEIERIVIVAKKLKEKYLEKRGMPNQTMITLTNEDDMNLLSKRKNLAKEEIHSTMMQIDLAISQIQKQMTQLKNQDIEVPPPPSSFLELQEKKKSRIENSTSLS